MIRTPFPKESNRKSEILQIIHTDVWGPIQTTSMGGAKYYIEVIDNYSKWCEITFLKSKAEAFNATKEYINFVEKQTVKSVKIIQSDNGREYMSNEFSSYLKNRGIGQRLTVLHNPEQNGTAERKNRTLLETTRCLLIEANLSESFWAEAVNTANYIRNRLPTPSLEGKTPYELWKGEIPDYSQFKIFGSHVYYLNRDPGRGKLEQRGEEGIFLGYSEESKAFRIWSPKKGQLRHVKFIDNQKLNENNKLNLPSICNTQKKEKRFIDIEHIIPENSDDEEDFRGFENQQIEQAEPINIEEEEEVENIEPRRNPGRPRGSKNKSSQEMNIPRTGTRSGLRSNTIKTPVEQDNQTQDKEARYTESIFLSEVPVKVAMSGCDVEDWRHAIASEMKSIIKNKTWIMINRPNKGKVISSRMIL